MSRRAPIHTRLLIAAIAVFAATALARAGAGQLSDSFSNFAEHSAIDYHSTPSDDAVARLNRRIADGSVQLKADGPSGYLRAVLDALNVPVESQVAVFAQDSFQRTLISRQNPRTLFFNGRGRVGARRVHRDRGAGCAAGSGLLCARPGFAAVHAPR